MTPDPCCTDPVEPARANPGGRRSLRYRIGTWSSFRDRMVRRLPLQPGDPTTDPTTAPRPLARLTTRAPDDPTLALIDAWACVADVLTFYGERILNEGYLSTATERRSVVEIARSTGYRPAPGRAATTPLAFTIDPNVDDEVVVPRGQAVLSVPGPGELPQTFELLDEILARAAWNRLRPRRTIPHTIERGTDRLYLRGVNASLAVGDPIVVLGAKRKAPQGADVTERWDLRFVVAVETVSSVPSGGGADIGSDDLHTVVTLDRGLGDSFTHPASTDVTVLTMRNRAGLFGATAPDARMMSEEIRKNNQLMSGGQWRRFAMADDLTRIQLGKHVIDLDQEYPGIVRGSWVCLQGPTHVELFRVQRATPAARADFSLTSRLTRLHLDAHEHIDEMGRRSTTVWCQSEQLPVAEKPDPSPVSGFEVPLDGPCPPMPVGRPVLVCGEDEVTGERTVVPTTVAGWTGGDRPVVTLAVSLPPLRRDTVELHGNVGVASHGATVPAEVLGHGDAGAANQRMALRHAPLTWVPAAPTGAAPELVVRVGGVEWARVPTLFAAGPNDHVYTVQRTITDDPAAEGSVVSFGDGKRGARLPSGYDNVVATYRHEQGVAGNVAAGQLTSLQQRPAAVRHVVNPADATGGSDPAGLDEIRHLAPLDALTLGRLVALQDYEDHAGTFPGVGKAKAVELWDGHRGYIQVTVAAANGGILADADPTAVALVESMDALKDPAHRVLVWGHQPVPVALAMRLRPVPGALFSEVRDQLVERLVAAFGFSARQFGQPLLAAEVAAVAHQVSLVHAVDIEALHRVGAPAVPNEVVPADVAAWDGTTTQKAELLELAAEHITIAPLELT